LDSPLTLHSSSIRRTIGKNKRTRVVLRVHRPRNGRVQHRSPSHLAQLNQL
jgi:hypothetical protein